jgi:hypothetical protein
VQYETCPRIPDIDYVKELGLGGLAALFGSSEEKPQDSEKLMDLYWNRAELKKSFADARKEHFRLQDKIKQQEGATARLQQKLDHLEELLIELHGDMISGWKAQLAEESAQIEERLLVHRAEIQKGEEQLEAERQQLESMGVLQRLFKGRSVKAVLKQLELQIETARAEETTLLDNLAVINDREPPKSEGLDISSKRSINLMIVAFAQQLYLQFADSDFATLVKDAGDKSVGSTNYGNQHECGRILERIEDRAAVMEQSTDFAGVLQKRVKLIGEKATFRNKSDVVPVAATVSTVFDIGESGMVSEREADLLGENYWRISKVLSR